MGEGEIRVLLCDDAAGFRALMRYALQEDPAFTIVGEAADGHAGLQAVAELRPDVVLLDLLMPRLDGLERRAGSPALVDEVLAQDLVDRFVAAGAERVFTGPRLSLTGPPAIVQKLVHHDDHLHVRLPAR